MAQGVRSRVACLSGKVQTTSTWRAPSNPSQGVEPHRDQSVWEHCSQSGYWESRVPGAGARAGTEGGQGRRGTLPVPRPQSTSTLSRGLSLFHPSRPSEPGCGLPVLWGVVYSQLPPPAPSGASWAVPVKASPLPRNWQSGVLGTAATVELKGCLGAAGVGEWVLTVGKGPGQMRPGVPHGQRLRVLGWLAGCWTGPRPPALAPQRCVGGGGCCSLLPANCTRLHARPLPSILKAVTLPWAPPAPDSFCWHRLSPLRHPNPTGFQNFPRKAAHMFISHMETCPQIGGRARTWKQNWSAQMSPPQLNLRLHLCLHVQSFTHTHTYTHVRAHTRHLTQEQRPVGRHCSQPA